MCYVPEPFRFEYANIDPSRGTVTPRSLFRADKILSYIYSYQDRLYLPVSFVSYLHKTKL